MERKLMIIILQKIYVNKTENTITFKIKTGYYLGFLRTETIKLLRCTKTKITKDKNDKNMPLTEVVLVHCNIVNSDSQQDSRDLYIFVPNKFFGQLLHISTPKITFLKTFISKFLYVQAPFADQISKLLGIEDKISITLVIN